MIIALIQFDEGVAGNLIEFKLCAVLLSFKYNRGRSKRRHIYIKSITRRNVVYISSCSNSSYCSYRFTEFHVLVCYDIFVMPCVLGTFVAMLE